MDFNLSESQLEVQRLARDFAQNKIAPVAMKYDESQEFPMEIAKELGEMGFLGIIFPEEYGGSGFSILDYAIIVEEISKADPSLARAYGAAASRATCPRGSRRIRASTSRSDRDRSSAACWSPRNAGERARFAWDHPT